MTPDSSGAAASTTTKSGTPTNGGQPNPVVPGGPQPKAKWFVGQKVLVDARGRVVGKGVVDSDPLVKHCWVKMDDDSDNDAG